MPKMLDMFILGFKYNAFFVLMRGLVLLCIYGKKKAKQDLMLGLVFFWIVPFFISLFLIDNARLVSKPFFLSVGAVPPTKGFLMRMFKSGKENGIFEGLLRAAALGTFVMSTVEVESWKADSRRLRELEASGVLEHAEKWHAHARAVKEPVQDSFAVKELQTPETKSFIF